MGKFLMTSKKSKEAVEKANSKGGMGRFKPEKSKSRLLILGPVKEDESVLFTTCIHQMFNGKQLIAQAASPAFTGEKDKIAEIGWKLKNKYEDSSDKKKKDFYRMWLPNRVHNVNVLNLDDIEAGPLVYSMSGAVSEEVISELDEVGEDLTSICDFDEGRILQVKSNMKSGLARRYKVTLLESTANLIEDGILDDDKIDGIAEKMYELSKLQPAFDEEAYESFFEKLKKKAKTMGISIDDLEDDEDEEDMEEVDEEVLEEEDDFEDDEDMEDDIEDIDDEDEEDGEDIEEEEDEDFDDDFEEEEEPPKRAKKKAKKKTTKKAAKKVAKKTATRKRRRRA